MVDIVDFLTSGQTCSDGHPHIHVILDESSGSDQLAAELLVVECAFSFDLEVLPLLMESEESEPFFVNCKPLQLHLLLLHGFASCGKEG